MNVNTRKLKFDDKRKDKFKFYKGKIVLNKKCY